ncbi:MAG: aspartyl protease family protein [Candidatus Cyclobacteriaceae bacterium M3_2C_046]
MSFKNPEFYIRRYLSILFIFFFINQSAGQVFGFEFLENKKRVVIPFEIYNNLIVVPVTLNGKVPLKFILDTGIRTAILTERMVTDILNVSYNRKLVIKGPGDGRVVEAYVANNVSLQLPGVVGRGQALLVLQEDYLQLSNYLGTEVHGILGYELFSRFVVEINYAQTVIILHKNEFFRPKKKFAELDLTIEDTKPYVNVCIDQYMGAKFYGKFLVDTGASHALLLEQQSDNPVRVPDKTIEAHLGRGLGGVINGVIGRVEEVQLDEYVFDDVIASFPDPESYLDSLPPVEREGTIGGEILNRFNVIFDYSQEKMYLKKGRGYNKSFEFNMSGLEVKAIGEDLNDFTIETVKSNSPASQIGLKPGDIIRVINGHHHSGLKLNYINSILNSKEEKKIRMRIERDGRMIKKVFRLKRLI